VHDATTVVAVLSFFMAVVGMLLGLPNLVLRLKDWRRQRRQEAVREVIGRRGVATKADMTRDGMRESDADKAIGEMRQSGEIVPSQRFGEVPLWRFKSHPHYSQKRAA
jgi:hypothetical protein